MVGRNALRRKLDADLRDLARDRKRTVTSLPSEGAGLPRSELLFLLNFSDFIPLCA